MSSQRRRLATRWATLPEAPFPLAKKRNAVTNLPLVAVEKAHRATKTRQTTRQTTQVEIGSGWEWDTRGDIPISYLPHGMTLSATSTRTVAYHVPKQRCSQSMLHLFSAALRHWQNGRGPGSAYDPWRGGGSTPGGLGPSKTQLFIQLRQKGYGQTPRQYLAIQDKENRSGMGRVDWPFYPLCQNVYGHTALVRTVMLSSSMAGSPALCNPPAEDDYDDSNRNNSNASP